MKLNFHPVLWPHNPDCGPSKAGTTAFHLLSTRSRAPCPAPTLAPISSREFLPRRGDGLQSGAGVQAWGGRPQGRGSAPRHPRGRLRGSLGFSSCRVHRARVGRGGSGPAVGCFPYLLSGMLLEQRASSPGICAESMPTPTVVCDRGGLCRPTQGGHGRWGPTSCCFPTTKRPAAGAVVTAQLCAGPSWPHLGQDLQPHREGPTARCPLAAVLGPVLRSACGAQGAGPRAHASPR